MDEKTIKEKQNEILRKRAELESQVPKDPRADETELDKRINEIDNNQKEMISKFNNVLYFNERMDKIRMVAFALMIIECLFFIIRFML